jgi:hypothetical protein
VKTALGRKFQNDKRANLRAVGPAPDRIGAMHTNAFTTAGGALTGITPVPEA